METSEFIEKRRLTRFIVNVKILDESTNEVMGYSANMHTQGMLISSFHNIPINKEFRIILEHKQLTDDKEVLIPLHIKSLWCKKSDNPDFYHVGVQIINPDKLQQDAINKIIKELAC